MQAAPAPARCCRRSGAARLVTCMRLGAATSHARSSGSRAASQTNLACGAGLLLLPGSIALQQHNSQVRCCMLEGGCCCTLGEALSAVLAHTDWTHALKAHTCFERKPHSLTAGSQSAPSPSTGAHLALLCRSSHGGALHASRSVTTQVCGAGQHGAFIPLLAVCTPWDAGGECAAWCGPPATLSSSPRPQLWRPPPSLLQPRRCPACQHDIRSM